VKKHFVDKFVENLRANKKEVEYLVFENEGHNFQSDANLNVFYESAVRFLDAVSSSIT
jgi:dipeptidyl aminopeptidase/acylaminoacyl peptidase